MPQLPFSPTFLYRHLFYPVLGFILLAMLFETTTLDLKFADFIYARSGYQWALKDSWFTHDLVHDGGRLMVGLSALMLIGMTITSYFQSKLRPLQKGLCYLLTTTLAAGLLINLLKEVTHIDCPWDLQRYGGLQIYIRNFAALPAGQHAGACFPAGHASAAWAWLGLYYFCLEHAKPWRYRALTGVLIPGLIFGVSQELRGAHFLSHDLWTLSLCWITATISYLFFYQRQIFRTNLSNSVHIQAQ